jgi:hypothetical protein
MAIPWMVLLKSVPWVDVIRNAPKVADAAKGLWTTVRSDKAANRVGTPAVLSPASGAGSAAASENAALRTRLAAAEAELRQLHEQVLQSSELIKMLAEQHQGLVARAELNRRRTVALAVATFVSVGLTIAAMLMISY